MRKVVDGEIKETEEELNQIEDLKVRVLSGQGISQEEMNGRFDTIEKAVTSLKSRLLKLRKKFSDTMAFVSRAKWFENGEKSNKFFLNLMKSRQNQKLIYKIKNGEEEFVGQNQVSKGITDFYRELYSSKPTEQKNEDNFYEYCPKLSEKQAKYLDNDFDPERTSRSVVNLQGLIPWPRWHSIYGI
jgi:hypothetical protein